MICLIGNVHILGSDPRRISPHEARWIKYSIQGVVFSLLETCWQGSSEAITHISDLLYNQLNVARFPTLSCLYGIWLPMATRRFHSAHCICSQQDLYLLSLRGFLDLCKCLTAFIFKADMMAETIRCCIYMREGRGSSNVHHGKVCIIQSVISCWASYPGSKEMNI